MQSLKLVHLDENDADALRQLTEHVGWNFTTRQVAMHLAAGHFVGHRDASGQLLSSAGLYLYGGQMAALGIVIVHPDVQRRGLGRAVVEQCLGEAAAIQHAVTLVATPVGAPLYASLGFQTIGQLARLQKVVYAPTATANHCGATPTPYTLIPMSAQHLPDIVRLDAEAFGARRARVYRALLTNVTEGVVCVDKDNDGAVCGFGLATQQGEMFRIGAIVARKAQMAHALVEALSARAQAAAVRIDVPAEQKSFLGFLHGLGFEQTHQSACMAWNLSSLPGARGNLYSIPDPAF